MNGSTSGLVPVALRTYMDNLFNVAFTFAGVLAFGAIVYSSVRYTLAAANPSQKSDAKDGIVSALLGLLLLLTAGVILNVINPEISNVSLPPMRRFVPIQTGNPNITSSTTALLPGGVPSPQAQQMLTAGGVVVAGALNLNGLQESLIEELISVKAACGTDCEVTVTGARRPATGQACIFQHATGYKVDLRLSPDLTNFIESEQGGFQRSGRRSDNPPGSGNGGPRYYRGGVEYVKEENAQGGPHWDVALRTCGTSAP